MQNLIETFLSIKAPGSGRTYRQALEQWGEFIGDRWSKAKPSDAIKLYGYLKRQPGERGRRAADATVNKKWHAVSSFYGYLVAMGETKANPFLVASKTFSKRQATQVRPTVLIPFKVVSQFFEAPDLGTKIGVRDRCIIKLLFAGALRRSEAAGLSLSDISVTQKGALYVTLRQSKAGKRQTRRLAPWAWDSINDLVIQRREEGASENSPLLTWYHKGIKSSEVNLTGNAIYKIFVSYAKSIGLHATPHSARATAASRLAEMGYRDWEIAEILGHASPHMARVYDKRSRSVDESVIANLDFTEVA